MPHGEDPSMEPLTLPTEPIDRLLAPLVRFLHIEAASGAVLLLVTAAALGLANSPAADGFLALWKTEVGFRFGEAHVSHSLQHWINDGLMVLFFFVVGLEVKRELVIGELTELRTAALPIAAALGGMAVPAAFYLALQAGEPGAAGWGIPMATDIAFVVGCMALLGDRVPRGLRVLLLSLAIADDIGAILVIAIGYSEALHWDALLLGVGGIAAVSLLARLGVRSFGVYTAMGVLVWIAFHASGVHATIAGVILGLQTPARSQLSTSRMAAYLERAGRILEGDWDNAPDRAPRVRRFRDATREMVSPLEYLESLLHPWVAFGVMPLFAVANAGVPFELADLGDPVAVAVGVSLLVGKPIGILASSWAAVKLGLARLPDGVGWGALAGGGMLAGIGFTMALFISGLALSGDTLDAAKVGVLAASVLAALAGMTTLLRTLPRPAQTGPSA